MNFFRFDDSVIESSNSCKFHVRYDTTLVNYNHISFVKINEGVPFFTVYFSNDKFIEIDKKHLKKFLEGVEGV